MKTPDEIKKALECCFYDSEQCGECPYYPVSCDRELVRDAREYIRQLEAQAHKFAEGNDALIKIVKRLETKRDSAIADMTEMAQYVADDVCTWCNQKGCKGCAGVPGAPNFNWRGVQKEE